jgi:hypothetical protein
MTMGQDELTLLKRDPDTGYLDSLLWVPKRHVNVEGTKKALTFVVGDAQSMSVLELYKETPHHILLPREFWDTRSLPFRVVDARPPVYPKVQLASRITLDLQNPAETVQRDAMTSLLAARGGILQLACGKGKSVVALELAARLQVPAIIIVDNTQLLEQWRDLILGTSRREGLLDISPDQLGLIQGTVFDWKKPIVLATYQTLATRAPSFPEEARRWFGLSVWDEAHHIAAPTFARSADLFYGYRLGLTATPTRDDGLHVVYDFHLGPVVFKDLIQELRPKIYFLWTGLSLDLQDPKVKQGVCDKNGEVHLSMLSVHFGQWEKRLELVLDQVREALTHDRKVLVLANSVDELMNLAGKWAGMPTLYTDIKAPHYTHVGGKVPPLEMTGRQRAQIEKRLHQVRNLLSSPNMSPTKRSVLQLRKEELEKDLEAGTVFDLVQAHVRKEQRAYLKALLAHPDSPGVMTEKVTPAKRSELLSTKQVTFAITKYGREGLDEQSLDTVIVCEPGSGRNGLQQIMGRVLRRKPGKKEPMLVFLEDDIPPMIACCRKLRKHLREWAVDEGGPYEYDLIGHPHTAAPRKKALARMRM